MLFNFLILLLTDAITNANLIGFDSDVDIDNSAIDVADKVDEDKNSGADDLLVDIQQENGSDAVKLASKDTVEAHEMRQKDDAGAIDDLLFSNQPETASETEKLPEENIDEAHEIHQKHDAVSTGDLLLAAVNNDVQEIEPESDKTGDFEDLAVAEKGKNGISTMFFSQSFNYI